MRRFDYANLEHIEPSQMNWTTYGKILGCIVTAAYLDSQSQMRVNVRTLRQDIPFSFVFCATAAPKSGDRGFITFADGRRDSPVYVGVVMDFAPFPVKVTAVNTSSVDVQTSDGVRSWTNVAYIKTGTTPSIGDVGLLDYQSGNNATPFYLGPLSQ